MKLTKPTITKGSIIREIEKLPPKDRVTMKSVRLANQKGVHNLTFTRGGIEIKITEINEVLGRLRIRVEAKKDGKTISVNNPLFVVNPPILVPDKFKDGIPISFKEDPMEALKTIIYDTVRK